MGEREGGHARSEVLHELVDLPRELGDHVQRRFPELFVLLLPLPPLVLRRSEQKELKELVTPEIAPPLILKAYLCLLLWTRM